MARSLAVTRRMSHPDSFDRACSQAAATLSALITRAVNALAGGTWKVVAGNQRGPSNGRGSEANRPPPTIVTTARFAR